jgi:NDP-sugar pyrophosphorylase family protein
MRAMIFAAGLGTRMKPITDNLPKALAPVDGVPLLEIVIRRLKFFGIEDIIINVHYLADQVEEFLHSKHHFDINIKISDERQQVLETGGGLKKAKWFFDDKKPFLVCNTDVLSNIDIHKLHQQHLENEAIATLAVQQRKTSRYLLFDESQQLSGWLNTNSGEVKLSRLEANRLQMFGFSSFQILDPRIFEYFPSEKNVFSTIDTFLKTSETERIKAYVHNEDSWIDVGTPENLQPASAVVKQLQLK